ncbi:MAG: AAA family ATPase [Alphaproteobacteria bacterium]|nr:AAA family ATPase [Alphaproteobacteria bacterium]
MFKRIFIDNYRCFTNFELVPGRVTLLLGPNGGGKSSLFDLLTAVVDLTRQGADVREVFPSESLTRWDKRERQRVEFDVEGNGGVYHYELVVEQSAEGGPTLIESERVTRDGKTLFAFHDSNVHLHRNDGSPGASFAFRGTRSFLAQIEERGETRDLMWLLNFLEDVWTIRLNARAMESGSLEEEETLARDGSNFASWYRHLTQEIPDRLQALWSALKPVVPGLQALKLLSSGGKGRARDLVAAMTTAGSAYDVDFDELSDGQRALIALYTLLEGIPDAGCLLLDEPEAHIGLAEVQPWLVELDEKFAQSGQVFVISHHPEVIDYLAASEPMMVERPDGGPARARVVKFDRDSGLPASQQLARGLSDGE